MAEISVIIPAWRATGTIERALRSVVAQTVPPREAVVVDDGSDDGTFEAAEACCGFMGGISLIVVRQDNAGAGAARNRAIRESKGDILAFLDADDEWLPTHLERSITVMEKGGYVLTAHNSWIVESGGIETLNDCAARFREGDDPFAALYRKGYIDTCTVLARRDAVLTVGCFDKTLLNAQDFELWLKLLATPGARFTVFDEPLCRYHLVPGSIMTYTGRRLRCCMDIARRYAPDFGSLLFRVAAIHYEALTVHRKAKALMRFLTILIGLPFRLAGAAVHFGVLRAPKTTAAFLWSWVVIVTTAYLFQFRPLVGPILDRLGSVWS